MTRCDDGRPCPADALQPPALGDIHITDYGTHRAVPWSVRHRLPGARHGSEHNVETFEQACAVWRFADAQRRSAGFKMALRYGPSRFR